MKWVSGLLKQEEEEEVDETRGGVDSGNKKGRIPIVFRCFVLWLSGGRAYMTSAVGGESAQMQTK